MQFIQDYKKITTTESKVSKALIAPCNIYKISSYQYSDGATKSLSGNETALVFVFGIHEKKLNALKISMVKPEEFFKWLKKLFKNGITEESFEKFEKLEEILVLGDKSGSKIYEGYIKNKKIGNVNESIYRTYNLSGVKQVEEVNIDKEYIKKFITLIKK